MMRKPRNYALGVSLLLCILLLAACGSSSPNLTSITVAPSSASVNIGASQQFSATGNYSDGTSKDITTNTSITWASASTSIATITSGGLATGKGAGTVTISASLGSVTGQANLLVTGASSIVVTPAFSTIAVAGTQQFTATGTIVNPDGTTTPNQDLTLLATWTSSQTTVATIDSTLDATNGLATGVANGVTQISASYLGSNSNSVTLTVGSITVMQLTIAPQTATLAAGQTQLFTATETLSNGTTQPAAPGAVAWSISCNPSGTANIGATTGLAVTTASGAGASCVVTGKETLTGEIPNSVSGTASLSVAAAVARFAYVANSGGSTISEYAANPTGGALVFLSKLAAAAPQQVIVHPSGNFLYLIDGNSNVHVYDITPTTGAIVENTSLAGAPYSAGSGVANNKGVIDPTGSFLYVIDGGASKVAGFTINQTTGALTALAAVSVGSGPTDVLVDHAGAYLYTINNGDGDVSGFTITPGTGVLVANPPAVGAAPYTAGSVGAPFFGTIDPTNTYVYVPDGGSNVYGYTIGSTGILTALDGSPFANAGAAANAGGLTNIVVTPNDKYIYELDSFNGAVYSFSVGAGGAIGAAIAATTPIPTGSSPYGIVVDPSSTLVAVDNNFSNTISLFQIGSTGALTTLTSASTDPAPLYVTFDNATAAANVTPAEALTADPTTGKVSAFTVAAGVLTADANSPYAGVAGNSQIGTSVIDNLFFTGSASGKQLAGYSLIPANSPTIAPLANSPVTLAGAAGPVIADPTGQYVFAADTTNNVVYSYWYNSTTNSLVLASTSSTAPAITGLQGLAGHPQGSVIYALSSAGTITPIVVSGGVFTAGAVPEAFAGNWTVGAVDGSGQYLFAVDGTAKKLEYFAITPVDTGGTDGGLVAVTSLSIPGATAPSGVVVDPTDRFVLVTDATADTITPFYFNPATSTLTAGTAVTTPSGAGQVTIDPTGKYVFVALAGAEGGTPPSGVAVYTVAVSSGVVTLTAVGGSPFTTGTGASGTTGVGIINSVK
jgi:6-phosphogluconolactonase (cycloisomerase 2 family)